MNESNFQRVYFYSLYPRDSKLTTDKIFINIGIGPIGGTHCKCFDNKDKKSLYSDNCRGPFDKLLLQQLTKPITFHNYKNQEINSKLCGTYCL